MLSGSRRVVVRVLVLLGITGVWILLTLWAIARIMVIAQMGGGER